MRTVRNQRVITGTKRQCVRYSERRRRRFLPAAVRATLTRFTAPRHAATVAAAAPPFTQPRRVVAFVRRTV